jgi:choline kinase/thiamine kinase-like enzyme
MPELVIIPTAGTGSRMGLLTKNINKALLPYKSKPALAHIIDAFPVDSRFVIPVGYLSNHVEDFLKLAYSDRDITIVKIDDFLTERSGTATTILQCASLIDQPFWYVSCDTIFDKSDIAGTMSQNDDVCWTFRVPVEDSHRYTMFKIDQNKITSISFKEHKDHSWVAFTGLMRIGKYQDFIERLRSSSSVEFIHSIDIGTLAADLPSWVDIGTEDLYKSACATQGFDFSKTGEYTWICNGSVIKWWEDRDISRKKIAKARENQDAMPQNLRISGSMIAYDYEPGSTLYTSISRDTLSKMLDWLKNTVWKKSGVNLTNECRMFYEEKTKKRIKTIMEDTDNFPIVKTINGRQVKTPQHYYNMIDWEFLAKEHRSSWIHGDLQFDNVILGNDGKFTAIDWRHEFGNSITIGDAYYDLAKLIGGCMLDYAKIKKNQFSVEIQDTEATISYPSVEDMDDHVRIIRNFCVSNGFDLTKIDLLIPIIFWNMAPLHQRPFDAMLWYLGTLKFSEIFDHEEVR